MKAATVQDIDRSLLAPRWLRGLSLFCTLLWFILRDYLRGPWLFVNALIVAFVQLFLLGTDPTRANYFGMIYLVMLAVSALNTLAVFSRANGPHTYAILARPVTRTTYVVATLVASWLVSLLVHLSTTALVYLRYGPPFHDAAPDWLDPSIYVVASLAIMLGVSFAASLMSLLSAFVTPFWLRLLVLGILAIFVMSFDPRTFPLPFLTPVIERMPPVLAPILGALHFATDVSPDSLAVASVAILSAYTSTLLSIVLWLSTRREIVLD